LESFWSSDDLYSAWIRTPFFAVYVEKKRHARCEVFLIFMWPWAWKIYVSILATQKLKHRPMSYRAIERKYRTAVLSDLCAILQMERFTLRLEWFRKKGLFFCRRKETESPALPFVSKSAKNRIGTLVSMRERIHHLIAQI